MSAVLVSEEPREILAALFEQLPIGDPLRADFDRAGIISVVALARDEPDQSDDDIIAEYIDIMLDVVNRDYQRDEQWFGQHPFLPDQWGWWEKPEPFANFGSHLLPDLNPQTLERQTTDQ